MLLLGLLFTVIYFLWMSFYSNKLVLFSLFFLFSFPCNAVLQLHTNVFTSLLYCWYCIVCHFVRSLMAFVCQEINDYLLTYLLTYLLQVYKLRSKIYSGWLSFSDWWLFAWCVRLRRLLFGFRTHLKSMHFHSFHFIDFDTIRKTTALRSS